MEKTDSTKVGMFQGKTYNVRPEFRGDSVLIIFGKTSNSLRYNEFFPPKLAQEWLKHQDNESIQRVYRNVSKQAIENAINGIFTKNKYHENKFLEYISDLSNEKIDELILRKQTK